MGAPSVPRDVLVSLPGRNWPKAGLKGLSYLHALARLLHLWQKEPLQRVKLVRPDSLAWQQKRQRLPASAASWLTKEGLRKV